MNVFDDIPERPLAGRPGAMDPGEFHMTFEAFGLNMAEAARVLRNSQGDPVRLDTLRRWTSGKEPIPDEIVRQLGELDKAMGQWVDFFAGEIWNGSVGMTPEELIVAQAALPDADQPARNGMPLPVSFWRRAVWYAYMLAAPGLLKMQATASWGFDEEEG